LQDRLTKKNLKFDLTPGALEALAKLSYDPQYGARPVKRTIRDLIEDPLTQQFLEDKFKEGDTVKIVAKAENQIELQKVRLKVAKTGKAGKTAKVEAKTAELK